MDQQRAQKPLLVSIGERAELLALLYEDRQLTTQQALREFEKLAQECVDADQERQQLGVDENTFALYASLKPLANVSAEQAKAINSLFAAHPDYRWDKQQESALRTALYKALRPLVGPTKLMEAANSLLRLQRI